MKKLKINSKTTQKLNKKNIQDLCNLKKQHWKFNLQEQMKWFKKNAKLLDEHVLIYSKKILVGYVHLGLRSYFKKNTKFKYVLFRNLIVDRKHRKKNISFLIMQKANEYIKKKKKTGFLICKKKMCKFYKKFGWKVILKKDFKLKDHKHSKMKFMTFGNVFRKKNFYYYL